MLPKFRFAGQLLAAGLIMTGWTLSETQDELKALDQRWADAVLHTDVAALGRILSDDLVYTHTDGHTENKAQFIESVRQGKTQYQSIEFDESNARQFGNTAVIVSRARVKVKIDGQERNLHPRFLRVYVKHNGVWQMVAHMANPGGPS